KGGLYLGCGCFADGCMLRRSRASRAIAARTGHAHGAGATSPTAPEETAANSVADNRPHARHRISSKSSRPPSRDQAPVSAERALLQRLIAGPVSGDTLARENGETRAAVWKRIEGLREA